MQRARPASLATMATVGLALALALALAPALAEDRDDEARTWHVIAIGAMDLSAEDGAFFEIAEDRIAGRSGCNRFTGAVTLDPESLTTGSIALGPVASTRMACPGRADTVEQQFLTALEAVTGYRIEADGTLILEAGEAGPIRARRF